jgi:hypothetical protein
MSALQKTGRPTFTRVRKNRVVVNNYKRQEEESLDNNEAIGETIMDDHQGLPPQPSGYLKFPTYDPF